MSVRASLSSRKALMAALLAGAAGLAASGSAHAHGFVGFGINLGGPVYAPPPVYYAPPPPTYYAPPPPVYYAPPAVPYPYPYRYYYAPGYAYGPPVYGSVQLGFGRGWGWGGHRHWR